MGFWHLTLASDGRQPLFGSEEQRRRALRALARIARVELVLFCIVDEHLHALLWCDRARLGVIRSALTRAIAACSGAPVGASRVRPVATRSHLQWLLRYILAQPDHHDLPDHPALYTGSCYQDLAGARMIEGLSLKAFEAYPRLRLADLNEIVGLERLPAPASLEQVRQAGAPSLLAAATVALGIGPTLDRKTAAAVNARRAVARIGAEAKIATADLVWVLELSASSVRRLRGEPVDEKVLGAVRLRLALHRACASRPRPG